MTDESSKQPGEPSPWSREVPIPRAPVEFTWATDDDSETRPPSSPGPAPDTSSRIDRAGDPSPGERGVEVSTAGGADHRPRNVAMVGIGAVLLLVIGWLVLGRDDDSTEIAADDSIPAEELVEDSLPTPDEPDDTEADDADDDDADTADETGTDGDGAGGGAAAGTVSSDAPEWRDDTIELPQVLLDSSAPFDLVGLNSEGEYIEVEVPAGRVSLVEIGQGIDGRIIAGATSTLFVSYGSTQGGRLLRPGEPTLELSLPSNVDISQVSVDGDEYAAVAYGNGGELNVLRVMADGGVVTTSGDDVEQTFWQRRYTSDGSLVVSEAGGVYLGGDEGFERISNGLLITASANHLLVRDCDEVMRCGYVTIDLESRERVEVALDDDNLRSFGFDTAQVSPDGQWLRYVAFSQSSADEVLVDLRSGEETLFDFASFGTGASVWAPDSSGFFRGSRTAGFEFFVVDTAETIVFGQQFGRMVSFDVRPTIGEAAPPLRTPTTTGLSLIGWTATGDVAQIDVDSGAVVTTDGPGLDSTAPVTIFPDAAGATFTSSDNVPSVRFDSVERTVLTIEGPGPSGPVWPGPEPGTVWQGTGTPTSLALELVDAAGTPLGDRIEFDTLGVDGVVGSDGRGGVVVEPELGGVFTLGSSGVPERITTGELLAINAMTAYVRECDDALQCGVFVVDRATGERTAVDNTGLARAGDISNRGVPSGQNVSPDGTVAFVRDGEDATRCLMVDITASRGAWTGVPCVDLASPIVWTPDSGYAVWLDERAVTIYDRSTRSIRVLNTVGLLAIAVTSNGAAPDGVKPES